VIRGFRKICWGWRNERWVFGFWKVTWGEGQNEGASLYYLPFFYLLFASRRIVNIPRMGVTVP